MNARPNVNLGDIAEDIVTGFKGTVVAVTNWLNGCQRVTLQPNELKDGKPVESYTFDVEQIQVITAGKHKINKPAPTGGDRDDRAALRRA